MKTLEILQAELDKLQFKKLCMQQDWIEYASHPCPTVCFSMIHSDLIEVKEKCS